jgi:hypothetical protein
MAGRFNPEDYEPVEDRIRAFWEDHPNGQIITTLVSEDDKRFIVKATVYRHCEAGVNECIATGLAEEIIGSSPVNRTHALENCETSAIGRALANANYAAKGKRPSREEMQKAERQKVTPAMEARDVLRGVCASRGLDPGQVADAYRREHNADLRSDDNPEGIRAFTARLADNPAQVLEVNK